MAFAEAPPRSWQRWQERLQQRLSGHSAQLRLHRRNLYILPTAFGGMWLLVIAITYVLGIQTKSNGPVLLGLLLLALLLLCPFLTHRNLEGLELRCLEPGPGFADQPLLMQLVARSTLPRPAVKLRWLSPGQSRSGQRVQLVPVGTSQLELAWQPPGRGMHLPGRLLIHTTAPLGLFRCWSYWQPPMQLDVAPARSPGPVQELRRPSQQRQGLPTATAEGSDDFLELSPLRPEAGLQRVAWKTVARGQGWYSKRFTGEQPSALWIAPAPGLPLEQALEHVCERLCRGLAAGEQLGLLLPGGVEIAPGEGERHRLACLRALAAVPPTLEQP
ncbi:MAG: DUF58 domain-containing protein [Cyanobacteria bacterium K_Offshore_0m_m2_072]|nr:DUF58 domain-containing protein [Cyanobacteria bacterium K_Offshore_0m_m2_072]